MSRLEEVKVVQPRMRGRMYAKKRWGYGRTLQLLTRVRCYLRGHDWQPWFFDWPYDCPDIPESRRDPHPNELLTWARGCNRRCGCIESADTTLASSGLLPGRVDGLYENPLRPTYTEYGGTKLP